MRNKIRLYCLIALAAVCSTGCTRGPSVAILGAFFPGWMICALYGVALTLLVRGILALARPRLDLHWPPLAYPLLAVLFGALSWILVFRGEN